MSASALVKKLLLKPGAKMALINAPAGYLESLGALPEGTEVISQPRSPVDFVHLFVENSAELEKYLPAAVLHLKEDGLFWVSYPKGTSKVKTDLNRDSLWEILGKKGWAGVSLVSLDEVWSAMRFRPEAKIGRARKS